MCVRTMVLTALLSVCGVAGAIAQISLATGKPAGSQFLLAGKSSGATLYYDSRDFEVVKRAAGFLSQDIGLVTGRNATVRTLPAANEATIVVIGTLGHNSLIDKLVSEGRLNVDKIRGGWEQYAVEVVERPAAGIRKALVIAGSDRRGTAYGVFSVSEAIGVSPWYWWADVPVAKKDRLTLDVKSYRSKEPSVKYRGLFINDEDFGLKPWAAKTFEPEVGDIGPKTYSKICELLLRMKGNYLCPAMHSCTKAFNYYPDNKLVADSLAIVMGSVHCEPLLFNNASEWDRKTMGEWNYVTNKEGINKVLRKRVEENGAYENVYTLALRGLHDRAMAGSEDLNARKATMQEALLAQKAYIAPLYDVKPDDPDFATLQRIAATGILRMTGEPFHWANRSWFYPERTIPVGEFTRGLHDFAPRIPVRTDTTALTAARAAKLIAEAGGKAPRIRPADADRPLTRRKLALLLEECLDPFARPVDLHGEYR